MTEKIIDLPTDIKGSAGFCWEVSLSDQIGEGDSSADAYRSTLRLFEDERELGPAHTLHSEIRAHGAGRFSHWRTTLFFSTSDNSDPRSNGRRYRVAVGGDLRVDERVIADKAAYELALARGYRNTFARFGIPLAGTRLLEIGPGENLGSQILLATLGAEVIVADRYLTGWRPLHPLIYQRLAQEWEGPVDNLHCAIRQRSTEGILRALHEPAEQLESLSNACVDVVISNAVLEHVYDLCATARELARVSRPAAWHFHQIDFRDHHNFERPLEHLLIDPAEFGTILADTGWVRGCQQRLSELIDTFTRAGFEIVEVNVNMTATEPYFSEFLPRLRASSSPWSDCAEEELRALSAQVIARAPNLR